MFNRIASMSKTAAVSAVAGGGQEQCGEELDGLINHNTSSQSVVQPTTVICHTQTEMCSNRHAKTQSIFHQIA